MRYYIVSGKPNVIYVGEISKSEPNKMVYNHNIKSYYVLESENWVEYPNPDSHVDLFVTSAYCKGKTKEFPSLEAAKKYLNK